MFERAAILADGGVIASEYLALRPSRALPATEVHGAVRGHAGRITGFAVG